MKKIFIDTNMYLRFYDSNAEDYPKLLNSLVEISNEIFISQQIVDEVNRNKLSSFIRTWKHTQDTSKKGNLPEIFDEPSSKKILENNKKRETIKEQFDSHLIERKDIFKKLLLQISNSEDEVSKQLNKIFKYAIQPTEENKEKARLRKELGNPPGKKTDTLGDQLSWEQFINQISNKDDIWIISSDSDYWDKYENKLFLNPFLANELKNKISNINIFDKLSDGLKNYKSANPPQTLTLPEQKILDNISKEESSPSLSGLQFASGSLGSFSPIYSGINNILSGTLQFQISCPNCGSQDITFISKSYIGEYHCNNCNNNWRGNYF